MNKWRLVVIALIALGLALALLILLTFDVRATIYEDGSIRIRLCIPYASCHLPFEEPDPEPLARPDYGKITLPTNNY